MNFSRYRLVSLAISFLLGIGLFGYTYIVNGGFARSISFDGGVRVSLHMPAGQGKAELEEGALKAGFKDPQVRLTNQRENLFDLELGPEVRDRLAEKLKKMEAGHEIDDISETTVAGEIEKRLLSNIDGLSKDSIVSRETISASYGSDLFKIAFWSFVWTVFVIGLYLSFRFDFPFAMGASLALIHDIILSVGFIGVMQIEPSIPVVAAVLTVVGYSINDTIVIFDRIRENMEDRSMATMRSTMDQAVTQTLSRTIITSLLTMISVVALLIGGADTLVDFAWVLMFGIIIGTFSSIFIASHFVQFYEEFMMKMKSR